METEGGEEQRGPDGSSNNKLLDRSKVRILLCDPDPKTSQEVLFLLASCSYQGTFFPFFSFLICVYSD
jgi:hypothetical protein